MHSGRRPTEAAAGFPGSGKGVKKTPSSQGKPNFKASTASEKIRIQNQIDQLDSQTNLLKNEYENVSGSFTEGDVESSKARLYSTNWMRDFSNSMSSKNVSQTVHSNPARADQLKVLQMQQDAAQFNAKYLQTEKNNKIRN